MIISCLSTMGC
uniref:Uncharacterized protein n=1 Tax=Rhizophora mucronata TaxID=61149 RepID=A0A2P2IJ61_RHIMU